MRKSQQCNLNKNSRYFNCRNKLYKPAIKDNNQFSLFGIMHEFSPQDSHQSQKSSGIHSQGVVKQSHRRSICQEEIISENYHGEFEDDELYNEESSLPLCMKEYYIHEKELNLLGSKQSINHNENVGCHESEISQVSNQETSKIKLIAYKLPILDQQAVQYQSTVEERNKILSLELQNEKIKNLHFQKMLSILIDEDSIQRQKLSQMSSFYREKYQQFTEIQQQHQRLKLRNQQLQKQVEHYKGLIYIANHNYELIENKLQETKCQVISLEIQKQERQKGFHDKLQNLKHVMKSLMNNLKINESNSLAERNEQISRLETKDPFCEGLYSFGDHDGNLREKKEKNRSQRQQVFNSVHNKGKPSKTLISEKTQSSKQVAVKKKQQDKQNLQNTQKAEDIYDNNRNYASNKTILAKLKSPKNVTVQENYRKLFMKTLVSSSQIPKNV